jgi:hypothetical protein
VGARADDRARVRRARRDRDCPRERGIPILGGYALREVEGTRFAISRVAWWLGIGFVAAQGLAFAEALRRYTVGINGPVFFFWSSTPWSPPLPSWLLVFGYLGLMVGLAVWVIAAARRGGSSSAAFEPVPVPAGAGALITT